MAAVPAHIDSGKGAARSDKAGVLLHAGSDKAAVLADKAAALVRVDSGTAAALRHADSDKAGDEDADNAAADNSLS